MDVRNATPDDAGSIADLNVAAWRIAFRGVVGDGYLAALDGPSLGRREVLANLSKNAVQLVVEHEGEIVGWLAAQPCEDDDIDPSQTFEVGACYVAPSHWRRGCGRLLMNTLVDRLRSSQWRELKVWAARDTPASHDFYRSLGFEKDGAAKGHALGDNSVIPVLRFSRILTKPDERAQ